MLNIRRVKEQCEVEHCDDMVIAVSIEKAIVENDARAQAWMFLRNRQMKRR